MLSNQGILSNKWLLPLMVITIAVMALAFWAMMGNKASAAPNNNDNGAFAGGLSLLSANDGQFHKIAGLSGWDKTSNDAEMVIDVSLECGLYTSTEVKSKGGKTEKSEAYGGVMVRVVIDAGTANETVAAPGEVVFCERSQILSATFQGLLVNPDGSDDDIVDGTVCIIFNPDTQLNEIWEECLGDEMVSLVLKTTNANAFNFVAFDLAAGGTGHTVEVQAMISHNGSTTSGSWAADAAIGKGSMIVYETRMAKTASPTP